MAFTFTCLSGVTEYEKQEMFFMIRTQLGDPVFEVELRDNHLEVAFCRAIREYSHYINQWAMENRISQMLGLPRDTDFTLKFVSNSLYFEKSFAKAYSEQQGMGVNSDRELKTAVINLTAGTQNYEIPAGREVNDVLWYTPSYINYFGIDVLSSNAIQYAEFQASYAGSPLYLVTSLFDKVQLAQSQKLRNKVLSSEYSYRIAGGPNGTKILTLYPVPRPSNDSQTFFQTRTPGTVFYRFYDTLGVAGNPTYSGYTANPGYTGGTGVQGNGLVSSPADAQLDQLNYADLNASSKNWIQKFALAISRQILGIAIRAKFGELPIPGASVTMNGQLMGDLGKEEMAEYREELKGELEKLNYKQLLENNANMQESINKTLGYNAFGIYLG